MITFGTPPAPAAVRSVHGADTPTTQALLSCSVQGVVWGLALGAVGSLTTSHRLDATLLATAAAGTAVGLLIGLYRAFRQRADDYDHSLGSMVVSRAVVATDEPPVGTTGEALEAIGDDGALGDNGATGDDGDDGAIGDEAAPWPGAAPRPMAPSYEEVRAELGALVAH